MQISGYKSSPPVSRRQRFPQMKTVARKGELTSTATTSCFEFGQGVYGDLPKAKVIDCRFAFSKSSSKDNTLRVGTDAV